MSKAIYLFAFLFFVSISLVKGQVGKVVYLPTPKKTGGMPLFEALNNRQSLRNFNDSISVDDHIVSQSLWACYGFNDLKHRTVPSSRNWYPLLIYVFLEEGVYLYDPKQNTLTMVLTGDYRKVTGTQAFAAKARINYVIVADFDKKSTLDGDDDHKKRSLYMETGHCAMALSLYAASEGMKGVDRAMVDGNAVLDLLGLDKDRYIFALAFSLGY